MGVHEVIDSSKENELRYKNSFSHDIETISESVETGVSQVGRQIYVLFELNNLNLRKDIQMHNIKIAVILFSNWYLWITNLLPKVLDANHAAGTQVQETELETRVFADVNSAAWNELYSNQEAELRIEADMLSNNLRSHSHHTQNILTGLQGAAETHELVTYDFL